MPSSANLGAYVLDYIIILFETLSVPPSSLPTYLSLERGSENFFAKIKIDLLQ